MKRSVFRIVGTAAAMLVSLTLLGGCGVGLSKPSDSKAREAVRKLTYVKDDKSGNCYAVVSTSHVTNPSDDGMSITWVPCSPKVLALIANQ